MRCDEVTRELAAPSDGRDDLATGRHLGHCEKCARLGRAVLRNLIASGT